MINAISTQNVDTINQLWQSASAKATEQTNDTKAPSFGNLLENMVRDVDDMQKTADSSLEGLVTGKTRSIQDVMLKMNEAEIAFSLMKEVRNKLIGAYKEVISMQS